MIPRVLHYCWFGRGKKPPLVLRCIESWRRFAPDFTIMEWNEDNFDVNALPFARDAYADKKYAFVSDYARGKILWEQGGVYLDTDMQLLKPLEPFLADDFFAGFEPGDFVAAGIIGAGPGDPMVGEYLRYFETAVYWNEDGSRYSSSNVPMLTALLEARGLRRDNTRQRLPGISVYPSSVFYPLDYRTGKTRVQEDTVTLHHYAALWLPWYRRLRPQLKKLFRRLMP
jgi:hypothetical protein